MCIILPIQKSVAKEIAYTVFKCSYLTWFGVSYVWGAMTFDPLKSILDHMFFCKVCSHIDILLQHYIKKLCREKWLSGKIILLPVI